MTGVLVTPRARHWWPRLAVFIPDRGRMLVGVILSKEVQDASGDDDDDSSHGSSYERQSRNGRHSTRRVTTCVTDPYTNSSGGRSVIEFRIKFA